MLAVSRENGMNGDAHRQLLAVDGNRDGTMVLFDHDAHADRLGADTACGTCHHLNMPFDRNTSCFECHRDMYEPTSLFDHESHERTVAERHGCVECHSPEETVKSYETATACTACHDDQSASGPIIDPPSERWADAVGYVHAMHNLCITCHEQSVLESPAQYSTELARCTYCHSADRAWQIRELTPRRAEGNHQSTDEHREVAAGQRLHSAGAR